MTDVIFDYVIIGGGTAGSVLANRLSSRAENRVLLIEAGIDTTKANTPPDIEDGLQPYLPRFAGKRYFWPDLYIGRAEAHPGIVRDQQFYEQGRILGGGSSVNMVVSNRGVPTDYDDWAARGATGWNWEGVLPYFRRLESDPEFGNLPEFAALHGLDGPLPIVRTKTWTPFTRSITESLDAQGFKNIRDQNGVFTDGYFPPTFTVRGRQRVSSAIAYLDDKTRLRPNLQIWTETESVGLLFSGRRVAGVKVRRHDTQGEVRGREIILAAGALQTPAILLRAGIGPAAELQALGIPVVQNSPGVGKNLWDHASLGAVAPLTPAAAADTQVDYNVMHQLGIRLSSSVDPAVISDIFLHLGANPETQTANSVFWVNKPDSSGYVTLRDASPDTPPKVDFRLLSDARDLERLKYAVRFLARILAHPRLARYGLSFSLSRFATPEFGGPLLSDILADEAQLENYIRTRVGGVWHASGTARIGQPGDAGAVVDPSGSVYGVEGLRVADASIFPTIPAANTNLPVVMAAEKISDAILTKI
ncbi:MAG: GMC family oxidoreductase N-terminal domain-containing protein [Zoogloeaceae bacterium]|jgi:5-(hydroxymethyl)furfural/furfural oxidase|nr:GMC family oxidoreductase N-terminal domain-containing protein [Zoogloeaceae bacterium]